MKEKSLANSFMILEIKALINRSKRFFSKNFSAHTFACV